MKEIDFLPDWYKNDKRRNASYRIQYAILGSVFVIMTVWNAFAAGSVSRAEADLRRIVEGDAGVEDVAGRFSELKARISELQKKGAIIAKADSHIDVASVLAELSFLIRKPAVLGRVELISEKLKRSESDNLKNRASGLVRAARVKAEKEAALPYGDVRFKVVISGIVPKPSDFATLICDLEDSAYFFQVVPSFSRNTQIAVNGGPVGRSSNGAKVHEDIEASEFEISCYLANYREESTKH